MKKLLRSEIVRILFAIVVTLGLADLTVAAEKDARVTQVIKDVRLLVSSAGARPATINEPVGEGQAVRTGIESRAELTFTDQTITRLGANTVFTYNEGAKEFNLAKGAVLMCVPKQSGTVRINTAAATAAVTGFTAIFESQKGGLCKVGILEGQGCITLKKRPNEPCLEIGPGELITLRDGATSFTEKKKFDIKRLASTGKLFTGFSNKLPKFALQEIQIAVDQQQQENGGPPPGGGYTDPTGTNKVDQKTAASSEPTPRATPHGSPPGARRDRPRRRN